MKKNLIKIMVLALALTLLSGCGADEDASASGKNIFYTRTASDEEVFSQILELEDEEEIELEDGAVPLSSQPTEVQEEGWLLVRYVKNEDGTVQPVWYRVLTEEGVWSQENLPYEGTDWNPVLPTP